FFDETRPEPVKRAEQAFDVPVLYPTRLRMPAEVVEHFPTNLPPLRPDLPTLIVGRFKKADAISCTVHGTVEGVPGQVTRTVTTDVTPPQEDNYFRLSLVSQWKNAAHWP